ncbi:hypothetical protein [Pyrobaculum aerophilum]|uniref:hypothetical protein n=1 Tax=Pyrobaculum aerophilum TaxID=13773 RepID=UPI0023F51B14|nr:hypothetical protein [Pyrobaculum aerophilum]MCX8137825.1 hypothetical protein [Pyrobaculum aerophilum]
MSAKKDRVNIAVARELAEELANTAESMGFTQFALANQILSVGLTLIKEGFSVQQIKDIATFYKVMTELETVPVPGRLLDKMVVEMSKLNKEVALGVWCEAGKMLAGYIKAVFGTLENATYFARYLANVVPARRFEIKVEGGEFVLDTIGVGYSMESVEVTASAVKCMLEDLGYEITDLVTAPGILRVKARRR